MTRSFAVSLGSLAMAIVAMRGMILGESADAVMGESIMALLVYAGIGGLAGAIADNLIRVDLEALFRKRVEWYRDGVLEVERLIDERRSQQKKQSN